jgi:hypothetical protein
MEPYLGSGTIAFLDFGTFKLNSLDFLGAGSLKVMSNFSFVYFSAKTISSAVII